MSVRNTSAVPYLRRKKVLPEREATRPKYEMGTLRPHSEPVTTAPRLEPPDSPGTKVVTEV